jgi:hypothetical protein
MTVIKQFVGDSPFLAILFAAGMPQLLSRRKTNIFLFTATRLFPSFAQASRFQPGNFYQSS